MQDTLPSESTKALLKLRREIRKDHHNRVADPLPDAPGQRNTRICAQFDTPPVPTALVPILPDRAQEPIGGLGPAKMNPGPVRIVRQDILRRAVRKRLACVELVALVLVAVLLSPMHAPSASDSQDPSVRLRGNFLVPACDSARVSVTAWIVPEGAVVTVRSEDGEDDDETCSATRQAYDSDPSSLPPFRTAPARDFAVPSRRLLELHPLRC
jgi:hypothetical protein